MRAFSTFQPTTRIWSFATLAMLAGGLLARPVFAGCGCSKPPPAPAQIRPRVTYGGMPVTVFGASLVAGQTYTVSFTAMGGQTASVNGVAAARRDVSDAVVKPQLSVTVPMTLPLGPTSLVVRLLGSSTNLLVFTDRDLTVAPRPIALPTVYGTFSYPNSQAAVDRDGVLYFSLDLTGLTEPLVFESEFLGYPFRFAAQDIVFKNTQGFLMQTLLQAGTTVPIPGMSVQPATTPATNSDKLHYSRHEFNTYFLQHQERLPHAVDPTDGNWHLDGTRHVDHDHLIVAVTGRRNDGTLAPPGATPTFNLRVNAFSLFHEGLVGVSSINMSGSGLTDSFDRVTNILGPHGDVFTNGKLTMSSTTKIDGAAAAGSWSVGGSSRITGARTTVTTPVTFMPIIPPVGIPSLGTISLDGTSQTVFGPGSFDVTSISLSNFARLTVDNSAGPVTFYVQDGVTVQSGSIVTIVDRNPEKFAVYVVGNKTVTLKGPLSQYYGVLYAPNSSVNITGGGQFSGSFVGKAMTVSGSSIVHYDDKLRGQ